MKKITQLERKIKASGNLPREIKKEDSKVYGKYFDGWKVLSDEEIEKIIEYLNDKQIKEIKAGKDIQVALVDEHEDGTIYRETEDGRMEKVEDDSVIRYGRYEIAKDLSGITIIVDLEWND
ncbi:MAG TPA: hypothetical protein P5107_10505 [Thermotogota bacterium]|nr:hypothetical protein [Thermotogota bacterium]